MNKILIVGATSSIAEHCARIWASKGDSIFLVGRNKEKLNIIESDLKVRGSKNVSSFEMDINNIEDHNKMIDMAESKLDGINIALIAHGTLPKQEEIEKDVSKMVDEIKTNAISTIAILTEISNRFVNNKSGTIAVISSVAGDRGRASNYVYGSAKAMVTTFASGLRQRLNKFNVSSLFIPNTYEFYWNVSVNEFLNRMIFEYHSFWTNERLIKANKINLSVMAVKPGFIDTPMTKDIKKGFLWTKPSVAALKIVSGIENKKDEIYVPSFWRLIMFFIKLMPNFVFKKIHL